MNQGVRLTDLPDPELPCHVADDSDLERIMPWLSESYPNWIAEVTRSVSSGRASSTTTWASPATTSTGPGGSARWRHVPTCAAEDRGLRETRGVGTATLLAALRNMRALGYEHCEIAWSGAVLFYLKVVGARISRVFWTYTKEL